MSDCIEKLIYFFSKLPSVGQKTAKRYVIHLLQNKNSVMQNFADSMTECFNMVKECTICGNFDQEDVCSICSDKTRDSNKICIVENISDLWSLEESGIFNGYYHILKGTLSAHKNTTPSDLNLDFLKSRIDKNSVKEIIIATSTTLDGQTTAFYISDQLKQSNLIITRLASGIPIGGELNYLDEGTITAAFNSRTPLD